MKKLALIVTLQLLFCTIVFGQTDNPGCQKFVQQADATCEETSTCVTATQCPRTSFTMDCTTPYYVKAYTTCTGTNCAHCAACVRIIDSGGTVVFNVNTDDPAYCEDLVCCKVSTWTPAATGNYTFEVCLVPCTEADSETCCGGQYACKAFGILSDGALTCP